MRILICNHVPLDGSGSGIYTLNVAKELLRAGHEVMVIVPEHKVISSYPFSVRTIIFSNGENIETDLDFNFPSFTGHPRSNVTFSMLDSLQIQAYVTAWRQVIDECIVTFQPDIIHANHIWVMPFVASATRIPYVITCHGTDLVDTFQESDYHKMALAAANKAAAIIAISRQVLTDARTRYFLPEQKVHLIGNGFDPTIFRVLPDIIKADVLSLFGLPNLDKPLVVFAGRLIQPKRVNILLQAAATYESVLRDVQTLIVGYGALWDDLHILREQLELQRVHFLGHLPQTTLARIFNVADICVFPSRNEPFGLVAIESLACGTPVVVTNAGGFLDFVNQRVGELVPVDDYKTLALTIVTEIERGSKQTKGQHAAQYALENFSWRLQVSKVLKLYEHVLNSDDL